MTKAKIKGILNTIVSIVGNGAILLALPEPYKIWAILAFNLLQVIYAFIDPTYTVELIKMGKIDELGRKKR